MSSRTFASFVFPGRPCLTSKPVRGKIVGSGSLHQSTRLSFFRSSNLSRRLMTPTSLADFTQWQIQPQATRLIEQRLDELAAANPWLASLSDCLLRRTGTKLVDWVDTIHLPTDSDLTACGFSSVDPDGVAGRSHHPGAQLPWVIADGQPKVVLRVESVVDFLRAQSI